MAQKNWLAFLKWHSNPECKLRQLTLKSRLIYYYIRLFSCCWFYFREAWPVCRLSLLMSLRFSFSKSGIWLLLWLIGALPAWVFWESWTGWLTYPWCWELGRLKQAIVIWLHQHVKGLCNQVLCAPFWWGSGIEWEYLLRHFLVMKMCGFCFLFSLKATSEYHLSWETQSTGPKNGLKISIFHSY